MAGYRQQLADLLHSMIEYSVLHTDTSVLGGSSKQLLRHCLLEVQEKLLTLAMLLPMLKERKISLTLT